MSTLHTYLQRIGEYVPDEALKNNIFSGTPLDFVISGEGGLPKAFSILVYGREGTGKTTVLLDYLSNIRVMNPDSQILYISAEMSKRQMIPLANRFPKFKGTQAMFIDKQEGTPGLTRGRLETVLRLGWDVVVYDSIAAIANKIRKEDKISLAKAEDWISTQISRVCHESDNERHIPTTVLAIQQVTKKGEPRGANTLMHDFDAVMELRVVDKNDPFSERCISCPKNRYSATLRLYYDLSAGNDVNYDGERLLMEIEQGRANVRHIDSKKDMYDKLKELFIK